jgi:hypothetical protein
LIVFTDVPAALVGMVQQARVGTPALHGDPECPEGEVPVVRIAAWYSLPLSPMTISVVSPTHRRFGASVANCRSSRRRLKTDG